MSDTPLPYKLAVLCLLYDEQGRMLLLHRRKAPNRDLYSPIGGKLETGEGESPTACAVREIREEAGVEVAPADLRLLGLVSESEFEGRGHWLMFVYDVTRPVECELAEFDEGRLEWHDPTEIDHLPLPESDREVIWPLLREMDGAFFAAHLDCSGGGLRYRVEQPADRATDWKVVRDRAEAVSG